MKDFRYVVMVRDRPAVAGFNDRINAEIYVKFLIESGMSSGLVYIEDQGEVLAREQARRKRVERILDAVRVLKEVA